MQWCFDAGAHGIISVMCKLVKWMGAQREARADPALLPAELERGKGPARLQPLQNQQASPEGLFWANAALGQC